MAKKDNRIWAALAVAVALLGAVVAVNYIYGWGNVYDDVKSMGKSVWFAFSDWVDVKFGDQDIVMPENLSEDQEIVARGTNVSIVDRVVNLTDRVIERLTGANLDSVQGIQNVNVTALQSRLSAAVGSGVQLVNVTLSTGRQVLLPLENATRRALGESFNGFITGVQQEFENFTSQENINYMINTVIRIPQGIIKAIQSMLSTFSGTSSMFAMKPSAPLPDVDAYTYAGR